MKLVMDGNSGSSSIGFSRRRARDLSANDFDCRVFWFWYHLTIADHVKCLSCDADNMSVTLYVSW